MEANFTFTILVNDDTYKLRTYLSKGRKLVTTQAVKTRGNESACELITKTLMLSALTEFTLAQIPTA